MCAQLYELFVFFSPVDSRTLTLALGFSIENLHRLDQKKKKKKNACVTSPVVPFKDHLSSPLTTGILFMALSFCFHFP
jgi:hypothetical protein